MTKHKNIDDQASFSAPIEDLNDQVAQQSLEIADLKKQMQLIYQRIESADLSEGIAAFDPMTNRPPHY